MGKKEETQEPTNMIFRQDFDDCSFERDDCENLSNHEPLADIGPSVNLGLQNSTTGSGAASYRTGEYCGYCWLRGSDGQIVRNTQTDEKVILAVKCRFDNYLKGNAGSGLANMLDAIMDDKELGDYLCLDQPEGKQLITFFFQEPLMKSEKIKEDHYLITLVSYIRLLERVTRRTILRRMTRKTANLTGNIRGQILFSKQITQNLAHGREDRIYCRYSERTVDILENQFLKCALTQASEYLKHNVPDVYEKCVRDVNICRRRLFEVSDVKCTGHELDSLTPAGVAAAYRQVFHLAKAILLQISMNVSGENKSGGVIPYAVNMPLLFECYARTRIKAALRKIEENGLDNYRGELLRFVPDKTSTPREGDGGMSVFTKKSTKEETNCYIEGNIFPDIVIAYYEKDGTEKEEPSFYRVYDVKYKKRNPKSARDDRLQLLAYDFMYDSKTCMGHIFPDQPAAKKIKQGNRPFNSGDIKLPQAGKRYIEFYLGGKEIRIGKNETMEPDITWLTVEEKKSSQTK